MESVQSETKDKTNQQEDLSAKDLTSFLNTNFSKEPESPEGSPHQINLDCNWLQEKDFNPSGVVMRELGEGGLNGCGIVLHNVFSRSECKRIIEETEKLGYGQLGEGKTGKAYRGNCRLQIDEAAGKLGSEIWRRISPFIPSTVDIPEEGGRFEYLEMNSRYRFAKYFAGQGFALHVDKPTIYEHSRCSIFTVNIYLNDLNEDQRGRTRFFKKMTGGTPIASVGGSAGSIAIFKQSLVPYSPVHDGEILQYGLKYLMRTDVIYTNTKADK